MAETTPSGLAIKSLSPQEYSRFSALIDESIEMAAAERAPWLARFESSEPAMGVLLRDFFASREACAAEGFLDDAGPLQDALATLVPAEPELVGRQFGPYRVLSLLGHGGMGSVWLAERADGLFNRLIALKLVHSTLVGRVITERFAREREILASLNHPNIARLLDAGLSADGQPYLALEYIPGTALTAYCDDHRLSIRARLQLYCQVLGAVQYAHAHLVIHRDLKPSNILVTPDGQVHLLDFGIAKLLTEGEAKATELTQLGGRALTPEYAAPEQILGESVTTAADIYGLGVMLYELLTGARPYRLRRDSRAALEDAILQADPVAPSRAVPDAGTLSARATSAKKLSRILRGDLDTIVAKALKKSPTERYVAANAFAEDIERYLRGDAVHAQRDSVAYRAFKFSRRHRVGIAATGILILTLAAGLAATSYEARVAAVQRDAAIQAQWRSLTQTAAVRLNDADVPRALSIILEVLAQRGANRAYTPEALSVFQEARAADAQILAITGHSDHPRSGSFSPDGRRVLTASYDKTARIWDAETGAPLVVLSGHTDRVRAAAFSPDGTRVVTASPDKSARIWDAASGRQLMMLLGHTDQVRTAAFSPDGQRVVTASLDKTARIWDVATGRELLQLAGHEGVVTSAAYSPDGRRIVTSSYDNSARIWDAATGRQLVLMSGHTEPLETARFSPDGDRVVTASHDKTARIWEASTGRQLMPLNGHTQVVISAAFSPDGLRVVTASADISARVWDAATGREVLRLSGHTQRVADAAFSPDGRRVVTVSDDDTARIWDAGAGGELLLLSGHSQLIPSVGFSADGARIVTGSADRTARIWDAASGLELTTLKGHTNTIQGVAFSPDGRRIVSASLDKTARIWDAADGRELLRLNGHTEPVTSATFSPNGLSIVTSSHDRTARLWDALTGRELKQLIGHTDRVSLAAFAPDGRRIVTSSLDKTARIWNAATGEELLRITGHTAPLEYAAFSPSGRFVATASDDKSARIWDAATGRQIQLFIGHGLEVASAAFSPDERRLVTASADKTARIWDVASGQQLQVLRHTDLVETALFSPDGRKILTASDDNKAHVWDARTVDIEAQIRWAQAAQFDPLPGEERFQLGLPAPLGVRGWTLPASKCDAAAAAPYDPLRRAAGVVLNKSAAETASIACADAHDLAAPARLAYQRGRAAAASGNFAAARENFERALAAHYPAAAIDLGNLLSTPSSGMLDPPRAIDLYERAWHDAVAIAAFALGKLYESGVKRADDDAEYLLAPAESAAWAWYQKGAALGEPNALAWFGARADRAVTAAADDAARHAGELAAFAYYAKAAEKARREDWPDGAWRDWRYHRASLARLLARAGRMQEAADAYDTVLRQNAPADRQDE